MTQATTRGNGYLRGDVTEAIHSTPMIAKKLFVSLYIDTLKESLK